MTINYKVSPCSRQNIRDYSYEFRQKFNLQNQIAFPIVEVFEALAEIEFLDYEIISVDDMPFSYGETLYHQKLIKIREDIYDKACDGDGFSRSTIAHELFHFLKHRNEEITFCKTVEEVQDIKTYEDSEWQANCFAGELLVPYHLVKGLTVEEVMEKCNVTRQMAEYQLGQYKKVGVEKKPFSGD